MRITPLSAKNVIELHATLLNKTRGSPGIRDIGLLVSAVQSPFAGFGDIERYPTLEEKAARLAFSIIRNHPFVDANKRAGILSMLTMLEINGVRLNATDGEIEILGLQIADGKAQTDDIYCIG